MGEKITVVLGYLLLWVVAACAFPSLRTEICRCRMAGTFLYLSVCGISGFAFSPATKKVLWGMKKEEKRYLKVIHLSSVLKVGVICYVRGAGRVVATHMSAPSKLRSTSSYSSIALSPFMDKQLLLD